MSKAEERALEAYPPKIDGDSRGSYDFNELNRIKYLQGYHQAEKDNELTWEDIEKICLIAKEFHQFRGFWNESVYQEVLKRFKNFKERK